MTKPYHMGHYSKDEFNKANILPLEGQLLFSHNVSEEEFIFPVP